MTNADHLSKLIENVYDAEAELRLFLKEIGENIGHTGKKEIPLQGLIGVAKRKLRTHENLGCQ